jgi:hypothetical protein
MRSCADWHGYADIDWSSFTMFDALGDNTERQNLGPRHGFLGRGTIGECAGQLGHHVSVLLISLTRAKTPRLSVVR